MVKRKTFADAKARLLQQGVHGGCRQQRHRQAAQTQELLHGGEPADELPESKLAVYMVIHIRIYICIYICIQIDVDKYIHLYVDCIK